jgi:uroporphyrinogen decarboxylase
MTVIPIARHESWQDNGARALTRPMTPHNDLLLRACRRESTERPPVWIMRQAGRYLPEYRAVRRRADFLTMVRTPELATEVTLQPVDLLGVDAAIIFSDILVVPNAMGMSLTVTDGVGPRFDSPVRTGADVTDLRDVEPVADLGYVLDAIRMTRAALGDRVPLIGFAGAPWTLASYMIEGGGSKQFQLAKQMLFRDSLLGHRLLRRLADVVGRFLRAQVDAGAQVLQLFESSASALAPAEFRQFALPYLARVASIVRGSGAPLIVFAPGAEWALAEIAAGTRANVMAVHWHADPAHMRQEADAHRFAIQGNLDPCVLYAPTDEIVWQTKRMLRAFRGPGYIANLGHGVLPDTPPDAIRAFVDVVQQSRGLGHERE